jgi:hypothetical protein
MNRWRTRGALVAMAFLSVVGCKKGDADGAAAAAASASAAAAAEPDFGPKMNGYIEHCLNIFSDNVFKSEDHYYGWAPKTQPPSEKTKDIKGILSTYIDPKRCMDAITKSNAMTPKDAELEAAGTRYGAAITALRPVLDDARKYYEERGYKTDKFSKAQELHTTLVKSFDEFDAANKALSARIDTLQDESDGRDLARIEKSEGRKLPFLVRATYVNVKAATRVAGKAAAAKDLALFTKAYTDLDTIVKELLAYRDAHGAEAHKLGVQNYTQEAEKFARFAREFKQKLEDKVPASTDPLDDQYNSVVRSLNNLRI